MDLKNEIKVGDTVVCIEEKDLPYFVGISFIVTKICNEKQLYYGRNTEVYIEPNGFPFRPNEIILLSPLMEELL